MKKIREVIDLKKCHGLENNTESENSYLSSVNHFNNQCRVVMEQMLTGRRLTTMTAMKLGIGDLRRRKKDLVDIHKVPVMSEYKKGSRFKEFFLDPEYIKEFNSSLV